MGRRWWTFSTGKNPIAIPVGRDEVERREKLLKIRYFVVPEKTAQGEFIIAAQSQRLPDPRCECTADEFWHLFEANGNLRIVMHRDPPHVFHIAWKPDVYRNRKRFLASQPVWERRRFCRSKSSVNRQKPQGWRRKGGL